MPLLWSCPRSERFSGREKEPESRENMISEKRNLKKRREKNGSY